VAISVQDELAAQADEADRLRRQQVDRARYEAELAQRRYLRVDPDNRLVAVTLESSWNKKLLVLEAAKDDYERQRASDVLLEEDKRQHIRALAIDFPRLWRERGPPASGNPVSWSTGRVTGPFSYPKAERLQPARPPRDRPLPHPPPGAGTSTARRRRPVTPPIGQNNH